MAEGQSNTLRFLTWNVNGLKTALDKKNLDEVNKADVVFLQETHIKKDETEVFKEKPDFWDKWCTFYTEYDKGQRGVAILIKKNISINENILHCIDPRQSAFIVLHCCLNDQQYTLVNVYHHENDQKTLTRLSEYLQRHTTGRLVIGGDFNTVFCPLMDKKVPTVNSNHSKMMQRLEPLMKSLQLVDVWRWCYPYWCFHTFKREEVASRLDYFFVQEQLLWYVQTCEIVEVATNDHCPVSLHLNNRGGGQGLNNGPGLFSPGPCGEVGCTKICRLRSKTPNQRDVTAQKGMNTESVYKHVTTVEIAKAIDCLQVSETRRWNEIQAYGYKKKLTSDLQDLQRLYSSILNGTSFPEFSFAISYDTTFHIFNVDYIILASILARRLNKALKSLTGSPTKLDEEKPAAVIYCFQEVPQSVEQSVLENALATLSPSPDVRVSCKILPKVSEEYLLRQGCPLTSSLHSLLLTYAAVEDLKRHFRPEDQDLNHLKEHVRIHVHKNFTLCVFLNDLKKKFEKNFHPCYVPQIIKESNRLSVMKGVPVSVLHAKGYNSHPDPPWCPRPPWCHCSPLCPRPHHCPGIQSCHHSVCCPGPPLWPGPSLC